MEKVENLINHIGSKIKYHRNLNRVSLSKLASDAGISKSTLFGLEEGRSNPTISTLVNIAKTLNIDLNELIGNISDENVKSSKLTLISKNSNSGYSLYRLSLEPYELFEFEKSFTYQISVVNGEVELIEESKILYSSNSLITSNKKIKALEDGVTAIVAIYNKKGFSYTKKDIFKNCATDEILKELYDSSINKLISRVIFKSLAPIDELEKTRYVNYFESIEKKESHYYFYRRFFGLAGGVKSLYNKLNINIEPANNLLNLIDLSVKNNYLSKSDFDILNNSIIDDLKNLIELSIDTKIKAKKLNSIYDLFNFDKLEGKTFYLLEDLLENNNNALNKTLIVKIYRVLECINHISEKELNSNELQLQNLFLENLTKSLYYAYCGNNNCALDYLKVITNYFKSENLNNFRDNNNYFLINENLITIINNHNLINELPSLNFIESIAKDLGLKIKVKELISPVLGKSGLYCYLFSKD